jgi:hypothetical protein
MHWRHFQGQHGLELDLGFISLSDYMILRNYLPFLYFGKAKYQAQ